MIKNIILCAIMICGHRAYSQVSVSSTSGQPFEIAPPTASGLNAVYVIENSNGLSINFNSSNSIRPVWQRFDNRGGGFAETIDEVKYTGSLSSLDSPKTNCGYIIEDGSKRYYFWLIDYSDYKLDLKDITVAGESDCSTTILKITGTAGPIKYYSINGMMMELSRDLTLSYVNLEYSDEHHDYMQIETTKTLPSAAGDLYVDSPLCATSFKLEGDKFLNAWGIKQSVETELIQPQAVATHTEAVQTQRDNDNEQSSNLTSGFGGSAPCEINFSASITDAVVFKEWQIASDRDFYLITYRDNNTDMNHTFRDEGTCYVRFMVANASGNCEAYGDTYEVSVGQSDIKCPNAFSPGSSEGINDEWKVSYKSIVEFECTIFNRWGVKIISFNDPSQGWDGKFKGKLVGSGVYYYVIKAKGADGKEYKLSGDINIINRNPNSLNGNFAH